VKGSLAEVTKRFDAAPSTIVIDEVKIVYFSWAGNRLVKLSAMSRMRCATVINSMASQYY